LINDTKHTQISLFSIDIIVHGVTNVITLNLINAKKKNSNYSCTWGVLIWAHWKGLSAEIRPTALEQRRKNKTHSAIQQ
jgi:hypothetical protein